MAKVNIPAENAKAFETIPTLKGFSKIAKEGETYATPSGKEFKVVAIFRNLTNENGSRLGIHFNFEIDGKETGAKRPEALSRILDLEWVSEKRDTTSYNPEKVMTNEEIEQKSLSAVEEYKKKEEAVARAVKAKDEFLAKFGNNPTFEGFKAFFTLANEDAKRLNAEKLARAEERKALKAIASQSKTDLAKKAMAYEELLAKLAANGKTLEDLL